MPKVTLISHSPDPERMVAAAARLCYSEQTVEGLLDGFSNKKAGDFVRMLMELGHESPVEHVSFTFALEGVSRSLLAQLTRHRMASYSVQSQRYVRLDPPQCVVPPEIAALPEALAIYRESMDAAARRYAELTAILRREHEKRLLEQGIAPEKARRQAEKLAIEDARYVLPNACETRLLVTMNARGLYNFFRHRCCTRAQWEIRAVAEEMLDLVRAVAPVLFSQAGPPCAVGPCPEGKMSCGRAGEMRQRHGQKADLA